MQRAIISWPLRSVAVALLGLTISPPDAAGDVSAKAGASVDSSELINYLFLHDYDSGPYTVGDEAALTLKVTPSWKLRDEHKSGWGLRLKVPLQFGIHIIKALEEEFENDEYLQTVSVTPLIEVPIKLRERWTLIPYQQVGVGIDFQGGSEAWTSKTGVRNVFPILPKPRSLGLTVDVKYGVILSGDTTTDRDYAGVSLKLNSQQPILKKIGKRQPIATPFVKVGYFFNAMHFAQADGSDPLKVNEEYEVGIKFATDPKWRVLGINLPRPQISFRWGDDLYAFRIKF